MVKQIELNRLILCFNTLVTSLNKAEEYFKKCTDKQYENSLKLYESLLRQASEFANRIEQLLGRPLTNYESLNGINI